MPLPIFYSAHLPAGDESFVLNEETSRHISQVLRMKEGEQLQLTNGTGLMASATILASHKKHSSVKILNRQQNTLPVRKKIIAISPIKNNSRWEWFLEKATEIGVSEIVPILCAHTEKQHLKTDRLQSILVSAMLQSQQSYLPILHEPVSLIKFLQNQQADHQFIAHCVADDRKLPLKDYHYADTGSRCILIGPEGDFSKEEIEAALTSNYLPVSLGETRLRTETAGLVAAVILE